jgi:hypothetical protein
MVVLMAWQRAATLCDFFQRGVPVVLDGIVRAEEMKGEGAGTHHTHHQSTQPNSEKDGRKGRVSSSVQTRHV